MDDVAEPVFGSSTRQTSPAIMKHPLPIASRIPFEKRIVGIAQKWVDDISKSGFFRLSVNSASRSSRSASNGEQL